MAKKMILVPEKDFEDMKQCNQSSTTTSSILKNVKSPNEVQLVKTFTGMEKTMNNPFLTKEEKMGKHINEMNEFTALKKKIVEGSNDMVKKETPSEQRIDQDTVNMLPPTLQRHGRQLLSKLASRPDLFSWSPSGEVKIKGKRVLGSNVGDLIGDIIRNRKQVNPARKDFLRVLADMNVAEEFVKNKQALMQYRKMKGSTRPPGIPEPNGLSIEESNVFDNDNDNNDGWEDDDDDDDSVPNNPIRVKRKAEKELKRLGKKGIRKKKIDWPNLYNQ